MDSSTKFYSLVWLCVTVMFLGLVGGVAGYNYSTNVVWADRITAMQAKGANPIAARCALQGTSTDVATAIMCVNAAK